MRSLRQCLLVSLVLSLLLPAPLAAQGGDENLVRAAAQTYQQGLEQLDPKLFWEAVETLSDCFADYPSSALARDNYLTATEILLKKIGTPDAYAAAEELLGHYLINYGSSTAPYGEADAQQTRRIQLALVQLQYTYRHDYAAAARELNKFYAANNASLKGSERAQVKLVEAHIQRKQEDFLAAKRAYGVAEQASKDVPGSTGMTFQREIAFCDAAHQALATPDGPHVFHALAGVSPAQSATVQSAVREAAVVLGLKLGLDPGFPLDIFIFPNPTRLEALTGEGAPYVLASDGELYVLPTTDPLPLLAQIYSLAWRVRPLAEVPLVLAEGWPSTFGDLAASWEDAAGQRAMLGRSFTPDLLLDSSRYVDLPQSSAVATAFVDVLIARYGVEKFGRLYGGWEELRVIQPSARYFEDLADPSQRSQVDVEAMGRAFRNVMGEDLEIYWRAFTTELDQVGKQVQTDFERKHGGLKSITVRQATPEDALDSWFDALAAGDVGALETLSAEGVRAELKATWADFKAAGTFEAVRFWSLARPYSAMQHAVVGTQQLGTGSTQFTVEFTPAGEAARRVPIMVVEKGGKWLIASSF